MIIVDITLTSACLCIAYGIYDVIRIRKKEAEDYEKFVESLKPNSVWTEKDTNRPRNPFDSYDREIVTIIETRYNHYDELWVRYKVCSETGIRAIKEDKASDFYNVYELTITV
jgi:hypothetical protein